jgi:hypothetical protein
MSEESKIGELLLEENVRRPDWRLLIALVIALLGTWRILFLGRDTTFFFDEWSFLLERMSVSIDNILRDHNGHLSAAPVVIYQTLVRIFGVNSYLPYRSLVAAFHFVIVIQIYVLLRRHVSSLVLLPGISVVAFMGAGWQNWLWAFQIGMLGSLIFGLAAASVLLREGTPRNQILVVSCVGCSLLFSGVGLSIAAATGLAILIRRWRISLAGLAAVGVLYGFWFLWFGQSEGQRGNLSKTPRFVFDSVASAIAGYGAWPLSVGGLLGGFILSMLVVTAKRRELPVGLAMLIVAAFFGWILTGISRVHLVEPWASRYVYNGVVLTLPLAVFAISRVFQEKFRLLLLTPLIGVFALYSSWDDADRASLEFRDRSLIVRAELTAVELSNGNHAVDYQPDPQRAPQITVGPYLDFASHFGSPAYPRDQIRDLPEFARLEMDRVFREAMRMSPGPMDPISDGWQCREVSPNEEIKVPDGARFFGEGIHQVEVRRFSSLFIAAGPGTPGEPFLLEIPADTAQLDWQIRIVAASNVQVCLSPI